MALARQRTWFWENIQLGFVKFYFCFENIQFGFLVFPPGSHPRLGSVAVELRCVQSPRYQVVHRAVVVLSMNRYEQAFGECI